MTFCTEQSVAPWIQLFRLESFLVVSIDKMFSEPGEICSLLQGRKSRKWTRYCLWYSVMVLRWSERNNHTLFKRWFHCSSLKLAGLVVAAILLVGLSRVSSFAFSRKYGVLTKCTSFVRAFNGRCPSLYRSLLHFDDCCTCTPMLPRGPVRYCYIFLFDVPTEMENVG